MLTLSIWCVATTKKLQIKTNFELAIHYIHCCVALNFNNMSSKKELKEGQEITINIPFTYTIGEEGFNSGKVLKTIQDCKDEVLAEIENGNLNEGEVFMEVSE